MNESQKKTFKWPWKIKVSSTRLKFCFCATLKTCGLQILGNASKCLEGDLRNKKIFFLKILNFVQSFVECKVSLADGNSCSRRSLRSHSSRACDNIKPQAELALKLLPWVGFTRSKSFDDLQAKSEHGPAISLLLTPPKSELDVWIDKRYVQGWQEMGGLAKFEHLPTDCLVWVAFWVQLLITSVLFFVSALLPVGQGRARDGGQDTLVPEPRAPRQVARPRRDPPAHPVRGDRGRGEDVHRRERGAPRPRLVPLPPSHHRPAVPNRSVPLPPDHLWLDNAPNLGPLIYRLEINKFENCWYKSVRILKVLKLLIQQSLNLSTSQRDISGPILGTLSNNRWSWGSYPFFLENRPVLIILVLMDYGDENEERSREFCV